MEKNIWTIGHSTQHILDFIEMLEKFDIKYLLDVRSTPYSAYASQFDRESLAKALKEKNIMYLWFWEEFGARYTDEKFLTNGKVDFEKVVKWEKFQNGVKRLNVAIEKWCTPLCLMCTEANPLECHRFSMISKYLVHDAWFQVNHIVRKKGVDGTLWDIIFKTHEELEQEMMDQSKKNRIQDLFTLTTREAQIFACYQEKNEEIWYVPNVYLHHSSIHA